MNTTANEQLSLAIANLENDINPVAPQEDVPSVPQRSGYLGVYENRSDKYPDKPFRAALCVNKGKADQKWMNLGYFKCEHVAAAAYNVASLNVFKGKGYLNPVDHDSRDEEDYKAFVAKRHDKIASAVAIFNKAKEAGVEFKHWELRAEAA